MELNLAKDLGIKGAASQDEVAPDSKLVLDWLKTIDEALKSEKKFRKAGRDVVQLYEGEKSDESPFNILYSNTETMLPALYNSTPRPIVKRRFQDEDVLGMAAGRVAERTLTYLTDDGNSTYTSFDDLMKSATLEALVPGRGVTRFKYDAVLERVSNEKAAENVESEEADEEEVEGEGASASDETVSYETVCGEEVPWDRFLHGKAKKWKDVPWVAFEHFMTREELEKNFGEVGARIPVIEMSTADDENEKSYQTDDMKGVKIAPVYEIWDKDERVVLFISPQWKSAPIKQVPDPLGLTGFFPCPRPLTFITKISTLLPVALYVQYEQQAKELNRITVRINKLISALKVRGLYDSTVDGIAKVLTADDNVLVPAENVAAMMAQGNALEKAIWLMPIEKLVSVLQQLYIQREQVKTTIYELTGIADIMRGSSQASETLGAQQIKNQWGTLRLKKTQKEVMRYARDCLRIMAEIAVTKLDPKTIKAMTGLPFPTGEEKQQAGQAMQQMQMMAQQTGQPPQIPPKLSEALNQPSWDELLAVLRDDTQRNYRIDIETNSTVDAEATEDKKDISELLNAMSQFLNGIGPLIENGTMPFDVAQGILLAVVRRYRFGPELEDQLKKMQAPKDPAGAADTAKQQAELAKAMEELKKGQLDLEKQKGQAEQALQQKQVQNELGLAKQAAQLEGDKAKAMQELELERQQMESEKQMALKEIDFAKQIALKEIDFATKQKEAETDQRIRAKEHSLSLKQAAHAESVSRTKEPAKV